VDNNEEDPGTEAVPAARNHPARESAAMRVPDAPVTTGDPGVDAVLAGLDQVPGLPVGEHAALYTELHDGLLAALNEESLGSQGKTVPVPGPGAG